MRDDYDPWAPIEQPADQYVLTRRRVEKVQKEFYWAKNSNNEIGVIVRLFDVPDSKLVQEFENSFENIQFFLLPDKLHLWICNKKHELKNQFRVLVHHVLSDLESNDGAGARPHAKSLFLLFAKWSTLLSQKPNGKLSANVKRGLLGELYFLSRVIGKSKGIEEAVKAWCGPAGHEQDFNYDSILYEVKSQLASSDKVVKISSLEQLDTISGRIILIHLGLTPIDMNGEEAISLDILIQEILLALQGNNYLIDIFEGSLACVGLSYDVDNLDELYELSFMNYYEISLDFPALKRSETPLSIAKVQYSIDMSALQKFEITQAKIWRKNDE